MTDKIAVVREYFDGLKNELENKNRCEDPSYKLEDLQKRIDALMAECEGIFKQPPPKPQEAPKEEAKAENNEASADANADVEMKDE